MLKNTNLISSWPEFGLKALKYLVVTSPLPFLVVKNTRIFTSPPCNLFKLVLVLLLASVERVAVSRMPDF